MPIMTLACTACVGKDSRIAELEATIKQICEHNGHETEVDDDNNMHCIVCGKNFGGFEEALGEAK